MRSLKRNRAARAIQRTWSKKSRASSRGRGGATFVSSPDTTTRNHTTGASNSLFISALPSTVDDALSESSHSVLLDLTIATEASGPFFSSSASAASPPPSKPLQRPSRAATEAYAAAIDASRLVDLEQAMAARAARRLAGVAASTDPSSSSPSTPSPPPPTPTATLNRLRDRSDALLHQLRRAQAASGGAGDPEVLHARRARMARRLEGMVARLVSPAQPADVLARAAKLGSAAAANPLRMSLDSAEGSGESEPEDATARPDDDGGGGGGENRAPPLPSPYAAALRGVAWPASMPQEKRAVAVAAHAAAVAALSSRRRWYQVHSTERGRQADLREVGPVPVWPALASAEDVDPLLAVRHAGQPGWKSLHERVYLPPRAKDAAAVFKPSPVDAFALATEGSGVVAGAPDKAPPPPSSAPAPLYAFETGPGARPSRSPCDAGDAEASDWWMAFACSPAPLYSRVAGAPAPPPGGSPSEGRVPPFDTTLPTAQRILGVADPWATAAAYLDPSVVTAEARAACAAAARLEAGAGASDGAVDPNSVPSLEDLLDLSADLAAAPPLDFFASSSSLAAAGAPASGSSSSSSSRALGGAAVSTPALAAPGESIAARVKMAYEALKRRLALDAGDTGPFSFGAGLGGGAHAGVAALAREVAARRIQHGWRGASKIRAARAELARRRDRAGFASGQRALAMQAAMAQFMQAMEATLGVGPGAAAGGMMMGGMLSSSSSSRGGSLLKAPPATAAAGGGRDLAALLAASSSGNSSSSRPPLGLASSSSSLRASTAVALGGARPDTAPAGGRGPAPSPSLAATGRPRSSGSGGGAGASGSSGGADGTGAYLRYEKGKGAAAGGVPQSPRGTSAEPQLPLVTVDGGAPPAGGGELAGASSFYSIAGGSGRRSAVRG